MVCGLVLWFASWWHKQRPPPSLSDPLRRSRVRAVRRASYGPNSGVLAYIKAFRQRANIDAIRAHVLGKYNAFAMRTAMRTAKDVLWDGCKDDLCRLKLEKKVRRTSAARSQELADLDDVLEALDALDVDDCMPEVVCSSEDLLMPQLLPVVGIEQVAEQLRCFIRKWRVGLTLLINRFRKFIKLLLLLLFLPVGGVLV